MSEPQAGYGGVGWSCGNPHDYDREYCVDRVQLAAFLNATQPEAADSLALDENGPTRRKFLARLQGEITKRGTIDVLRHGVKHVAHHLELFYGTPSAGNEQARERFEQNRFTVTRQLRYSGAEAQRALDIGLFINGLPVFTFELKNSLTKQTVDDAVWQYKKDRNPREKLFEFGRCIAHFAVDESEARFCTQLKGKASWFLPFNRGWNDGAGNPPNPNGIKTDYLWRSVLARESLTNILENYAQVVSSKDEKTGKKKRTQIWPRYHQLDVVRRLLDDAAARGAGRRYLIQHSAGSGKSNSIAWLAHQLIGLEKAGAAVFDSIIVVTDRRILDRQIRDTIRQYAQVKRHGGSRGAFRRPARVHRGGQEDHYLDGPEVPLHPRRDRQHAARAALRHHHRRGPFQPGRPHKQGHGAGALGGRQGGRGGDVRGSDQPGDGVAQAAPQRQLLRVHRDAQEQDAGDFRRAGPAA